MKRPIKPAGGWPWLKPGFTFSINWPPGYAAQAPAKSDLQKRAAATKSRNTMLDRGITGSIAGLSKKADAGCAAYRAAGKVAK